MGEFFSNLQNYDGTPRAEGEAKTSKWQKFIEFLLPYLKNKRQLGDQFLVAKVRNEEAQAMERVAASRKNLAEASKFEAEARQIAIETALRARELEDQKWEKIDLSIAPSEDELQAQLDELIEKLNYIRVVHGTKVSIALNSGESNLSTGEE